MSNLLINIEFKSGKSFQNQIREKLVELIVNGQFGSQPLPSGRKMAQQLGVSRNTVVLVYESLVDDGYLIAKERSGYFVNPDIHDSPSLNLVQFKPSNNRRAPNWGARLFKHPADYNYLVKDKNWMDYEFPFIYGQVDTNDFPIYQWRECARIVLSRSSIHEWVEDSVDQDDPELIDQIRQQILSKRGIAAMPDEILLTLGTQNSLSLLASLLADESVTLGAENPGFPDLRHIFKFAGSQVKGLDIDGEGVELGMQLSACDYICVTPSHQYPTTVTMSLERRKALLKQAHKDDFVIIEDDYESEVNFIEEPLPALKSMDRDGRVIYTGSLSKSLSPGLRCGYLVADSGLIRQLRAARRLSYRHPPTINQRIAAQFIAQGYYDSHVRRMRRLFEQKWRQMNLHLHAQLETCHIYSTPGSFCFWIGLPEGITAAELVKEAAKNGILVEAGDSLFLENTAAASYIRLGFSAINEDKIVPGINKLEAIIQSLSLKPEQQQAVTAIADKRA